MPCSCQSLACPGLIVNNQFIICLTLDIGSCQ